MKKEQNDKYCYENFCNPMNPYKITDLKLALLECSQILDDIKKTTAEKFPDIANHADVTKIETETILKMARVIFYEMIATNPKKTKFFKHVYEYFKLGQSDEGDNYLNLHFKGKNFWHCQYFSIKVMLQILKKLQEN